MIIFCMEQGPNLTTPSCLTKDGFENLTRVGKSTFDFIKSSSVITEGACLIRARRSMYPISTIYMFLNPSIS